VSNAATQVGGVTAVQASDQLQLDVFGWEVVEKSATSAQQHRHHVHLQLVELAGLQQGLRGPCAAPALF
jgi:hypothetical protein